MSTSSSATTQQSYWFSGSGGVSGLPADAVITSITMDNIVQNRDDSQANSRYVGAYDPGNGHVANEPVTCTTSYANITGCDFTSRYNSSRLGAPYQPSRNTGGTQTFLYNGGGQTTGAVWDPSKSSRVSVKLISNWTNFTFPSGVTARAWTVRFTGDPVAATNLLTPDANGCLGFTAAQSKDTPLLNILYSNVPTTSGPTGRTMEIAQRFTITYTSRGQTYTLTRTIQGNWQ